MRRWRWLIVSCAAVVLAATCGTNTDTTSDADRPTATPTADSTQAADQAQTQPPIDDQPQSDEPAPAAQPAPQPPNIFGLPGSVVFTRRDSIHYSNAPTEIVLVAVSGGVIVQSPQLAPAANLAVNPATNAGSDQIVYVEWIGIPRSETEPRGSNLRLIRVQDGVLLDDSIILEHRAEAEFFWTPRWTPDGRGILYARQLPSPGQERVVAIDIEWLDVDTGAVTLIREHAADPALSPDGTLLAYIDEPALEPSLAVLQLDSGAVTILAGPATGLILPRRPLFSPDGDWIAFLTAGDGPQVRARPIVTGSLSALRAVATLNGFQDIWLIRPNGDDLRRLTSFRFDSPDIAWSPDGSQILLYGPQEVFLIDVPSGDFSIVGEGVTHGWVDWVVR